ncbi:MAG: hypothetical protein ACRDJN_15770 [Chloroflexota bacterium]
MRADERLGDFFRRYGAVRTDGVPAPFQEAYVRAVWAQRDQEREREAAAHEVAEALIERHELRLLLTQTVVPLTTEERAALETKLAACQARLDEATARTTWPTTWARSTPNWQRFPRRALPD